jgi:hypothetical protein
MALTWAEIERSQLFTWFHCGETGRERSPDGGTVVRLKPGGFQEFIDIELDLDAAWRLRRAALTLDRAWAGGAQSRAFADDLAKSFLLVLSPEGSIGRELGTQIDSLLGANPAVIRHVNSPLNQPPPDTGEGLQAALDAYTGARPEAEVSDGAAHVRVQNGDFDGRQRVRLELLLAEPGQPAEAPVGFVRRLFHRTARS